jgi:hypothetical protein
MHRLIGAAAIVLAAAMPAHAFDTECKEIVPTSLVVSDLLMGTGARTEVRQRLLDSAGEEAIRQVVGVKVSSRTGSEVSSVNNEVDERFQERMRVQSSGYARYQVVSEQVVEQGAERVLELAIDAEVCIPLRPALVREIVAVGPALNSKGENLAEFRDIIANAFSSSPAFSVSPPEETFADVTITGRINEVRVVELDNTTMVSLSSKGPLLGNSRAPDRINRITVNLTLEARRDEDGSVISHAVQDFTNSPVGRDPNDVLDRFIVRLITKATDELHDKLLSRRADAGGVAPAAFKATTSNPSW